MSALNSELQSRKWWNRLYMLLEPLAGPPGIEPRSQDLESRVLPLNYSPKFISYGDLALTLLP